ncbi:MAG: DUF2029 domain-containing protein [Anaerolineales bacterium]|nr:MAG: DUF2029 domain-containing protein [Anaerolineales bacterium]
MFMSKGKVLDGFWLGIGVAAIVLVLSAYYFSTWPSFSAAKAAIDTCDVAFCDFRYFYYPMGGAIFSTDLPVKGFVYSPFIAILMSVFPLLGLEASIVLWGVLQALSIIFYLLLFYRLVPAKLPIQLLFAALALSSFPMLHILTWGQVGLFTTIAILGALVFYERGQLAIAAGLLAFAISFKFFPLVFLVPFAVRRDIRFLLMVAVACGLCLFVVPGIVLGVDGMQHYYSALLDSYKQFDWVITNYNSQFFPHVILRIAEAMRYDIKAYLPVLRWISYGIAAFNIGIVFVVRRTRLNHANLWSFHILFLSISFILQTSWPADLIYMPFGQALIAWQFLDGEVLAAEAAITKRRPPALRATAIILLVVSVILSNLVFFNLVGDRVLFGSVGFIFWADLLLLASTYMVLLPAALQQNSITRDDNSKPAIAARSR